MPTHTLPHAIQSLTYRQLVDLFRSLGGGTVGFDYSKYKLAQLQAILIDWVYVRCAFSAEYVEMEAERIAASVATAPAPVLPTPPAPAPQPFAAPSLAPQIAPPAPSQPFAATLPASAPVPDPIAPQIAAPSPVVDAPAPAPSPSPAPTTYPQRVHASVVFPEFANQFPPDLYVDLYGNPEAPTVDPDYIFHYGHVLQALIALTVRPTLRVWLGGPRGTGKTKFAEQIAAHTSRPLFRVNFNRATEASEIVGDTGLTNGNTDFVYGPVAAAAVTQGALLLLDELTYGSPGNVSSLNAILERLGAHLRLPRTDRTLIPAEGFAIFVADNTFGFGDNSGMYAARLGMGFDTRDRINVALTFDYLPQADEAKLLRAIVKRDANKTLLKPVAAAIVNVMSAARKTASDGDLMGAPSLRGAAAFATLIAYGVPVADAYMSTVVLNAPVESHEKLQQIFAAHWPADLTPVDGSLPKFTS